MARADARLVDVTDLVEEWQRKRMPLAQKFSQDGLREFVEFQNYLTRKMMGLVDMNDPEFWSAWIELGQNASTMAQKGKIFADKIDRTNL